MAQVKFAFPIEEMDGRLSTRQKFDETGKMVVSRTKKHRLPNGKVIIGKNETYYLHKHEGPWSANLTAHRMAYKDVLSQAHAELKNADKKAAWTKRWEEHLNNAKAGEKVYYQLFGFVVATLWKESR